MKDALAPLDVLVEDAPGDDVPLPPRLGALYGRLALPLSGPRPGVIANFVQSLDGVVTLDAGNSGGGPVSGKNGHDRAVMGLLRAVSDAVIVGGGTLRSVPKHRWTPGYICPSFSDEFRQLRAALKKPEYPLNVIVTASGDLDPRFAIFQQQEVPVLVITTRQGAENVTSLPSRVDVAAVPQDRITPSDIMKTVSQRTEGRLFLSEAGPKLFGELLTARLLDDVFLTLSPQIAGRDRCEKRPGLVAGHEFAPDDPRWFSLVGLRRAGDFLFLRYALAPLSVSEK